MSKFYTSGKPFKLDEWNKLIRAVNDILKNPTGAGCEAVAPLDEVTDPHRWAKSDIREVRDALKKTCPDIAFSKELRLWKEEVIDEIETQMDKAWCNCEPQPDKFDSGEYPQSEVEAAPSPTKCCGAIENGVNCMTGCGGIHCYEYAFYSPFYPCIYKANAASALTIDSKYNIAFDKGTEFIESWNDTVTAARQVKQYQSMIDSMAASMDALIAKFKATCNSPTPPTSCQGLKSQICSLGKQIKFYQTQVDKYDADMMLVLPKIRPAETECNAAATENNTMSAALKGGHLPPDINHWSTTMQQWYKPNSLCWGNWFDPYTMDQIADVYNWMNGVDDENSQNGKGGVRPQAYQWWINNDSPTIHHNWGFIKIAPNGSPFLTGQQALWCCFSHGYPYELRANRVRCEPPIAVGMLNPCNPANGGPGDCEFYPWVDYKWYWGGGIYGDNTGCVEGAYVFEPINPPTSVELARTQSFHTEFKWTQKDLIGKDYRDKQDQFLDEYTNWYTNHPKYDNRHSAYC